MAENHRSNITSFITTCKFGNKMCNGVKLGPGGTPLMPCDICCSEPGFCRGCCCILCCKSVKFGSYMARYNSIECEAKDSNGYTCAHLAHLDCALRTSLAGTVEGDIRLDAEYHCRRCDARTDLVRLVWTSMHTCDAIHSCKSIDSLGDIEKIMEMNICILRNSEREVPKWLLRGFEFAIAQVKLGIYNEDIWKTEDDPRTSIPWGDSDESSDTLKDTVNHDSMNLKTNSRRKKSASSSYVKTQSLKLEDDIHKVLQSLRKSQEAEYEIAEKVLSTQKNHLLHLYEKLHEERSELLTHTSSVAPDSLLEAILNRLNQIKAEQKKLEIMEEVATGFGHTSKGILKEHFGIECDS